MRQLSFTGLIVLLFFGACERNNAKELQRNNQTELDYAVISYHPFRPDRNCYDCYPSAKVYFSVSDTLMERPIRESQIRFHWKYEDLDRYAKILQSKDRNYVILEPGIEVLDHVGGYYDQVRFMYQIIQKGEFSLVIDSPESVKIIRSSTFKIYSDTGAEQIRVPNKILRH